MFVSCKLCTAAPGGDATQHDSVTEQLLTELEEHFFIFCICLNFKYSGALVCKCSLTCVLAAERAAKQRASTAHPVGDACGEKMPHKSSRVALCPGAGH